MIPAMMLTDRATVLVRTQSGTDAGGNPTYGWVDGTTVAAAVQPTTGGETTGVDVAQTVTRRRLWTAPDVTLSAGDRVRTAGRTWQVEGPPHVWTGPSGPHHLEATLLAVEDT